VTLAQRDGAVPVRPAIRCHSDAESEQPCTHCSADSGRANREDDDVALDAESRQGKDHGRRTASVLQDPRPQGTRDNPTGHSPYPCSIRNKAQAPPRRDVAGAGRVGSTDVIT
jgi:hypothetical protein